MQNTHLKKLDSASEFITTLQSLIQNPLAMRKELELGLLQQYLDDESLYIKQIPRVNNFLLMFLLGSLEFLSCLR